MVVDRITAKVIENLPRAYPRSGSRMMPLELAPVWSRTRVLREVNGPDAHIWAVELGVLLLTGLAYDPRLKFDGSLELNTPNYPR
jgi:hypothetical protein